MIIFSVQKINFFSFFVGQEIPLRVMRNCKIFVCPFFLKCSFPLILCDKALLCLIPLLDLTRLARGRRRASARSIHLLDEAHETGGWAHTGHNRLLHRALASSEQLRWYIYIQCRIDQIKRKLWIYDNMGYRYVLAYIFSGNRSNLIWTHNKFNIVSTQFYKFGPTV